MYGKNAKVFAHCEKADEWLSSDNLYLSARSETNPKGVDVWREGEQQERHSFHKSFKNNFATFFILRFLPNRGTQDAFAAVAKSNTDIGGEEPVREQLETATSPDWKKRTPHT